MQLATLKKSGKRVLQIGLPLAILVALYFYVQKNWSQLPAHGFAWNPWLMLLAFVGFLLQEISFALIWRSILARLGSRLGVLACLRVYLASEFVRYIPGNVWHVLTRILWISKYGVSRPVALMSVALLVLLHPRVLGSLLNTALRILKREPVVLTLRYRDVLLVTAGWCTSWVVAGIAFYVLLLSLWPATPLSALPLCIGIYAIAWDIGFVSFLTPSGLGFREGAISFLFALALPMVPASIAVILAVLSRLVSTFAELVCVSVAYLIGRPPLPGMPAGKSVPLEPPGRLAASISTPEMATQVGLEGSSSHE